MLTSTLDGSLFLERYGAAPVRVLALHGWGRDRRDWDTLLKARDDAVAVDLPGFGLSPAPGAVWGAADYAHFVQEAFPDEHPLVVLGHSFGGRVAVELAVQRPALVRALVLTGVPLLRLGTSQKPAARYRAVRALHQRGLVSDARMDMLRRQYGSEDYRNAEGIMRDILVKVVNEDYREQLRRVQQPVSLVWGAKDTAVDTAVARAAEAELADATLVLAPNSGHLMDADLTDLLATALRKATSSG